MDLLLSAAMVVTALEERAERAAGAKAKAEPRMQAARTKRNLEFIDQIKVARQRWLRLQEVSRSNRNATEAGNTDRSAVAEHDAVDPLTLLTIKDLIEEDVDWVAEISSIDPSSSCNCRHRDLFLLSLSFSSLRCESTFAKKREDVFPPLFDDESEEDIIQGRFLGRGVS